MHFNTHVSNGVGVFNTAETVTMALAKTLRRKPDLICCICRLSAHRADLLKIR